MQVVHIYAETGSIAPRNMRRQTGCVLEYVTASGRTVTREFFRERDATYNASVIQTITEALDKLTKECEVHVHTQNQYVLHMIAEKLQGWSEKGFTGPNGLPIANQTDWKDLWEAGTPHELHVEFGMHPYYEWLNDHMKKRREHEKVKKD